MGGACSCLSAKTKKKETPAKPEPCRLRTVDTGPEIHTERTVEEVEFPRHGSQVDLQPVTIVESQAEVDEGGPCQAAPDFKAAPENIGRNN